MWGSRRREWHKDFSTLLVYIKTKYLVLEHLSHLWKNISAIAQIVFDHWDDGEFEWMSLLCSWSEMFSEQSHSFIKFYDQQKFGMSCFVAAVGLFCFFCFNAISNGPLDCFLFFSLASSCRVTKNPPLTHSVLSSWGKKLSAWCLCKESGRAEKMNAYQHKVQILQPSSIILIYRT